MRKWFLIATLVFAGIGIYGVFNNNSSALNQRNAILASDKAGQDTALARGTLANFVAAHMGSSVSFALSDSYNRDLKMAQSAIASTSVSGTVYAHAQAACSGQSDSITQAKCVTNYVSAHVQPGANPQPVALPSAVAYQYHYAAPGWTPDIAGLSLVLSLVSLTSLVVASVLHLRTSH
jgi:hypothetical protein